jgi:hypothetical protein
MPLFRRRVPTGAITAADGIDGAAIDADAARLGWAPIPPPVYEGGRRDRYWEASRVLHGTSAQQGKGPRQAPTNFHQAYRTVVDGREVVVANGSTHVTESLWGDRPSDFVGTSICVAELAGFMSLAVAQPRGLHPVATIKWTPTGDAAFDAVFRVAEAPALGPSVLTPEVRRLMLAHDDWLFLADEHRLGCVGFLPFLSVADMQIRIAEVLAIVAAFPPGAMPAVVDHSQDGLVARIARLTSVEDALAFLQALSSSERAELAASNTPLAAFADVTTPEQAMARFESLPNAQRLAVLTMFQRVGE